MERMASALGAAPPDLVDPQIYQILKCRNCALEFASPMRSASPEFYRWLTLAGLRYPSNRWEWHACSARIRERSDLRLREISVMDIGSGEGDFLRLIGGLPRVRATGLEHNPEAIRRSREKGLEVIEGDLGDIAELPKSSIDVITCWHVVEHIEDPVELLSAAAELLRPGGELMFSVPLSPMSYEHAWPDPFNEPPHHLTRWNPESLAALAKRLGMRADLDLPPSKPAVVRWLRALLLRATDGRELGSRSRKALAIAKLALANPSLLWREWKHQRLRLRLKGRILPDVVLVTLHPQSRTQP